MSKSKSETVPLHVYETAKTELDALHTEHDELKIALKAADDTASKAVIARDIALADVKNLRAALDKATAELAKAPKPAPAETIVPVGSISLPHGILVLADQKFMDEKWVRPTESQSAVAVDFTGPDAAYLANRQKDLGVATLADGTLRILVPDRPRAAKLKADGDAWLSDNGSSGNRIVLSPTKSSKLLAMDAARARGVGVCEVEGMSLGSALLAENAQVTLTAVLGADGKPTEMRIRLR